MSAVVEPDTSGEFARLWPLLAHCTPHRVVAWRDGRMIRASEFLADVRRIGDVLPKRGCAVNLCEDRYAFLASFCAVAGLGQSTLLPAARTAQAIAEVRGAHADTYLLGDAQTCASHGDLVRLPELGTDAGVQDSTPPMIRARQIVAIGYTSGSTGRPKPNAKSFENFRIGSGLNIDVLASAAGLPAEATISVVATVPAQHMYGMEMSILLPLFGNFAVHTNRPFFPADIAEALSQMPSPRVLVTTPVHLRALLGHAIALPPVAAIVSATAPLPRELAEQAEARLGAPLIELFGSTETCVIGHRRTAREDTWSIHPGVELRPHPDGTEVRADHLSQVVQLQDLIELRAERKFLLRGRNADLLEIAGKRASLADLTRRLQALDGVVDAAVFQLEGCVRTGIQRIAALAVAPGRLEKDLLAELRRAIDPVFLPRPLRIVSALPRNDTGKLPRAALLAALGKTRD